MPVLMEPLDGHGIASVREPDDRFLPRGQVLTEERHFCQLVKVLMAHNQRPVVARGAAIDHPELLEGLNTEELWGVVNVVTEGVVEASPLRRVIGMS